MLACVFVCLHIFVRESVCSETRDLLWHVQANRDNYTILVPPII